MRASLLEDFLDEEVVDKGDSPIGTLACYWESTTNHLFLGIKLTNEETVRVVPGAGAEVDQRESRIRLGFDVSLVASAPVFDCDRELRPRLEQAANEHFAVSDLA
jgi:hypothetical protein